MNLNIKALFISIVFILFGIGLMLAGATVIGAILVIVFALDLAVPVVRAIWAKRRKRQK